jgi:hypothetical protein
MVAMIDKNLLSSLDRIAKHLPNTSIDHLSRFTVDERGRIWVEEDTTLIILRGHLILEHELIDICKRFVCQPDALPNRIGFEIRLQLVRAIVGDERLPKTFCDILFDLNQIRNKLTHVLDPKDIENDLQCFVNRFSVFTDFDGISRSESMPARLSSCIVFLTGALSSIKPVDC